MKAWASMCVWAILASTGIAKPPLAMTQDFNPDEVAWASRDGTGAVSGSALLRTVGGEVKTCAALEVNLIPYSKYSTERMLVLFGSEERGFEPARKPVNLVSGAPEYEKTVRQSICDAQGNFAFEGLPDGKYFLTAEVTWGVPLRAYVMSHEGGVLMRQIEIRGGKSVHIMLNQ